MKIVGATGLCGLRCVLSLNLKSQFSIFDSFGDIGVHTYDCLRFLGGKVSVDIFFWANR